MLEESFERRSNDDYVDHLLASVYSPGAFATANRNATLARAHLTICNDESLGRTARLPTTREEIDAIERLKFVFLKHLSTHLELLPPGVRENFAFSRALIHCPRVIPRPDGTGFKVAFAAELRNDDYDSIAFGRGGWASYKAGPVLMHIENNEDPDCAFDYHLIYSFASHAEDLLRIQTHGAALLFDSYGSPDMLTDALVVVAKGNGRTGMAPSDIEHIEVARHGHTCGALRIYTGFGTYHVDVPLRSNRWYVDASGHRLD